MNEGELRADAKAIEALVAQFFSLFTNKGGRVPNLERIFDLFIAQGVIVKNLDASMDVFNLREFIEPRKAILTDGTLRDFEEWEERAQTDILGKVAQRKSFYRKRGVYCDEPFEACGVKVSQFIRTADGWRFTALAWDDDIDEEITWETF